MVEPSAASATTVLSVMPAGPQSPADQLTVSRPLPACASTSAGGAALVSAAAAGAVDMPTTAADAATVASTRRRIGPLQRVRHVIGDGPPSAVGCRPARSQVPPELRR